MRKLAYIFFLIFNTWTWAQAQEIPVPKGWKLIDSITGNLDQDSIKEKVVIYNTTDSTDFGKHRELRIFKKEKENWVLWKSSRTALLNSDDGGMMGDPYGGVEIKNHVLHIYHNGGSSWKWGYTDKYRFQNSQFELIGYTSLSGKPCEEWTKIDFNISTGKVILIKEDEECNNEDEVEITEEKEIFYKKGTQLTLKDRRPNETEIISPKLKYKFQL